MDNTIAPTYHDPSMSPPAPETPYPFKVSIVKTEDNSAYPYINVSVSPQSYLFERPYSNNLVPLLGRNIDFTLALVGTRIPWAEDIYLETFYNRNRTPLFSMIRSKGRLTEYSDTPWREISFGSESVEMIKKAQVVEARAVMDTVITEIDTLLDRAISTIDNWVTVGVMKQESRDATVAEAQKQYAKYKEFARELKSDLNHFFDDAPFLPASESSVSSGEAPENIWLKQFRSWVPIASFVSNPVGGRESTFIRYYPDPRPTSEIPWGVNSPVQLVQLLKSNLVLVDGLYDNTYPIKVAIPQVGDTSLYAS